jgi:hypothetical protein
MEPASAYLAATLEPRSGRWLSRAWHHLLALLGVVTGLGDGLAPTDLVVRSITTGDTVMRTPADIGSQEILLDQVERDLASMDVEQFRNEWSAQP